jgi:hypothetical protein
MAVDYFSVFNNDLRLGLVDLDLLLVVDQLLLIVVGPPRRFEPAQALNQAQHSA